MASDDAAEVLRSEQQVTVDTATVPYERVRVRKAIVTEEVTVSITLHREVLQIEREPLERPDGIPFEDEPPPRGPDVIEVVLHEEVPVVGTRVVPRERVVVQRVTVERGRDVRTSREVERVDVDARS